MIKKSNGCYGEMGVVSEYEDKGLAVLERKIYSKYLTKPEARILDVGCFVGRISFPLAKMGYKVMGIDTSSIAIKRAVEIMKDKKIKNVCFKIASADSLPFKSEIFDYVLFPYNTIEAIPTKKTRAAAIKEASRVLTNDGLLLFSILNRFYPKYLMRITMGEAIKFAFKVLRVIKLDRIFPVIGNEKYKTEFGSILWIEPGGAKFSEYHFSSPGEIRALLKKSSFKVIEKKPVMNHGPQRSYADILEIKSFLFARAPVIYYICKKR